MIDIQHQSADVICENTSPTQCQSKPLQNGIAILKYIQV
jgi:hypothetical protein